MLVEGGYTVNGISYGRGLESYVPHLELTNADVALEDNGDDRLGLFEIYTTLGREALIKAQHSLKSLWEGTSQAAYNMRNPDIPRRMRLAALSLPSLLLPTAMVLAQARPAHAESVDHNNNGGHTLALDVDGIHQRLPMLEWYDAVPNVGDGGPSPDSDDSATPTITPPAPGSTETRYYAYMPLVSYGIDIKGKDMATPVVITPPATEPLPTAVPPKETPPIATGVPPTEPASPTLPPTGQPPTELPPTLAATATTPGSIFNPDAMVRYTVYDADADAANEIGTPSPPLNNEGVMLTTGGADVIPADWLDPEDIQTLVGSGFRLEDGQPNGVELVVEANPDLPEPIKGSKILLPDDDPQFELTGQKGEYFGYNFQNRVSTKVGYDAKTREWNINKALACDDDDIPEALPDTHATITLLAQPDPDRKDGGEIHYVNIRTTDGASCDEEIKVGYPVPEQMQPAYRERRVDVVLPPNTKGVHIAGITRLRAHPERSLIEQYPKLAAMWNYIYQNGAPDVAFSGSAAWQDPDLMRLMEENYFRGIAQDPEKAYWNNAQRLGHIDLLLEIARQKGWNVYMPGYVSSYNWGYPGIIFKRRNENTTPELTAFVQNMARTAYPNLLMRWPPDRFPNLTIAPVANLAADEAPFAGSRRTHIDYQWENAYRDGAKSSVEDVMGRAYRIHNRRGPTAFEQHGIMLDLPANYPCVGCTRANGQRIIKGELAKAVPPKDTKLVLPVFSYPDGQNDQEALLATMSQHIAPYVDGGFRGIYVPVYPNTYGGVEKGLSIAAAALQLPAQHDGVRVAVPGFPDLVKFLSSPGLFEVPESGSYSGGIQDNNVAVQ